MGRLAVSAMLSTDYEPYDITQEDLSCITSENECLDDIKPDLVSLSLSDSVSSIFHPVTKYSDTQNTLRTNCDDGSEHLEEKEDSSDSLLSVSHSQSKNELNISPLVHSKDAQNVGNGDSSTLKVAGNFKHVNSNNTFVSSSQKHLQVPVFCNNIKSLSGSAVELNRSQLLEKGKLSFSLQDVSKVTDFPLKRKSCDFSSDTLHSNSMITVSSGLKSKDSGLARSVSFLSLSSRRKSYDHVQSKVKEYIWRIKETERLRKCLTLNDKLENTDCMDYFDCAGEKNYSLASQKELTDVIKDLRHELKDKDMILAKLQENYDKLLMKYAEAQNKIDRLRFKVIDPSLPLPSSESKSGDECDHCPIQECTLSSDKKTLMLSYDDSTNTSENFEVMAPEIQAPSSKLWVSNNIEQKSSQKLCSSVVNKNHKCGTKKSTLNPFVKLYSSSVRLDKSICPLSHKMETKAVGTLTEGQLSTVSSVSNLKETLSEGSDKWLSSTNSDKHNAVACPSVIVPEAAGKEELNLHSENDSLRLEYPKLEQCSEIVRVPEKHTVSCHTETDNKEKLLRRKYVKQSDSFKLHGTSFEKVVEWKKSLPPLELITPSHFESLDFINDGGKMCDRNLKKFISPEGRDSGCPESDLSNFPLNQVKLDFCTEGDSKLTQDIAKNSEVFQLNEAELINKSPLNTCFNINAYSTCTKTQMHNNDCLHFETSKSNKQDFQVQAGMTDIHMSSCMNDSDEIPTCVLPDSFSVESCECWKMENVPNSDKEGEVLVKMYDKKPKTNFENFEVPRLHLGSLLAGDNDNSMSDINSLYSIGTTTLSETADELKGDAYSGNSEDVSSISHLSVSENMTYPSTIYSTSESLHNVSGKLFVADKKPDQTLSNVSVKTGWKSDQIPTIKYNADSSLENSFAKNTNQKVIPSDYLQASTTTSTSYRSLYLCNKRSELESTNLPETSEQKYSSTLKRNKISSCKPQNCEHCTEMSQSNVRQKSLLNSCFRYLILQRIISANRCLHCCMHNRLADQQVCCINCKEKNRRSTIGRCDHSVSLNTKDCVREKKTPKCVNKSTSSICDKKTKISAIKHDGETDIKNNHCAEKTGSRDVKLKAISSKVSELHRIGVMAPDASENQLPDGQIYSLKECLDHLDQFAEQLKMRSEAILNILAVESKTSS